MASPELDATQRAAQEQFSRQSERYAKGHILEAVEDVAEIISFVSIPAGARVLDVACGAGHTGLYLASLGHHVTCADLSSAMLERTRAAATARGLLVETGQHPAETMPYADRSFDLVTCRVAPHHFSSPAAFVSEVARVLRPGEFVFAHRWDGAGRRRGNGDMAERGGETARPNACSSSFSARMDRPLPAGRVTCGKVLVTGEETARSRVVFRDRRHFAGESSRRP